MSEDAKVLTSAVGATIITLGLGAMSAFWVDRVVAPLLRGTDFDFLLFICAGLLVIGNGYAWYKSAIWIMERLDGQ